MRDNDYPRRVSDPEKEGVPGTADADSTAFDDVDSPRVADGLDPAALPADQPVGADDFGTTAEEQRRGEPLGARLIREEPDTALGYPDGPVEDADQPDSGQFDADVLGGDEASRDALAPHPESPVSTFERIGADSRTGGEVGRLVEPDEGASADVEADAVAADTGAAGGGPSAEEQAMHEERP